MRGLITQRNVDRIKLRTRRACPSRALQQSLRRIRLVSPDALGELAGDADVERAVVGSGDDVHVALFFQNALPIFVVPAKAGTQRL